MILNALLTIPAVAQTAAPPQDWASSVIAIAGIAMITIITVVVVWQALAYWRARMLIAREQSYQRIAEESAATQTKLLGLQETLAIDVAQMRERVTRIEAMLREVG